jgi:hypothetical protein
MTAGRRVAWVLLMLSAAVGVLFGIPLAWVTWQVGHGAPVWAPVVSVIVTGVALVLAPPRDA